MKKFIIKRILILLPTILGVTFIVFSIMALSPGDPATLILGVDATMEDITKLNHELGYDRPFLIRFADYVINAAKGDFGSSYQTGKPVFEDIISRFPATLKLSSLAILLAVIIGVPLGILSAVKQYSAIDYISTFTTMFITAIPGFWLGLMLMLVFSLQLNLLPSNGIGSYKHYIMPMVTLALPIMAVLLRLTRATMLETIRQDYIKTVRAKGAPEYIVIFRHALRNALLPVVTSIGMYFGHLIGGAVLIETVFSIPGLGFLIVKAIRMKDIPQVMAAIVFISVMFMLVMLIVDILYGYIDPRIKAKYQS
jgi:peptide/nickel transport system permease protein